MPQGGARNRSGPPADPNSATSERRGLAYRLLPRGGFSGKPATFPLPKPTTRERALWRGLWKTPQAAMWNEEPWRIYTVAQYCRWAVRAEEPDAPAAILSSLHRLADQIGLTPAGLKDNGWRLPVDELGAKREAVEEPKTTSEPVKKSPPVRRLRA